MHIALLVLLIVLAFAGGLYIGHMAGQSRSLAAEPTRKGIGTRAREAATKGAIGLWKWNRARKKKTRSDES
ncbi:MAG: hypothetical protein K0V04_45515 [Deltaproteobacteria bacterium]|nr:hypothetical protein [Deltaproteobacteria bacterium]